MDNADIRIRPALEADVPIIREIACLTWPDAYGSILSAEQLTYMLDLMYSPEALLDQLSTKGHRFLLAEQRGTAQGFASFGAHPTVKGRSRLHKLYVLPATQGTGLGRSLLKAVEEACTRQGTSALELNVNRHNRARDFYLRNGFTVLREEVLEIGKGYVMDDFVLLKSLA